MRRFVIATANPHKVAEMRHAFSGLNLELVDRPMDVADVDETEETLEGNALLKARALSLATSLPAISDDTGLFVDALDGRPGVYSARYAGESASYADNVRKVLNELSEVPDELRGAHFRSVVAVSFVDGESWTVDGVLDGRILPREVGSGGFGYDSIFIPRGATRSLAELSMPEKDAISHRGQALRACAQRLTRRVLT